MKKIVIFAGTKDGRELAEQLCHQEKEVHIFVATEYGEAILPKEEKLHVHQGRLNAQEMEQVLADPEIGVVVDATHPYAVEVSKNIRCACESTKKTYLRMLREQEEESSDCIYVDSKEAAAEYLNRTEGNLLFTTGSKDLDFYAGAIEDISRMYVRILADGSVVEKCSRLGLKGKQIICMQGPFSSALNEAMIKQLDAKYLLTKDTGITGGFPEKVEGAKRAGAKVVVIRRPEEEGGLSIKEVWQYFGLKREENKRRLSLVGIGMGSKKEMTKGAIDACQEADVILGARRMVEFLGFFGKPTEALYQPKEIELFLQAHPEYRKIVVAFSGDVGFYSGTSQMLKHFDKNKYDIELICGISSPVYASSRFGMSWQDMKLMSIHGRKQNLIRAVATHPKVFTLVGTKEGVQQLAQTLLTYGLSQVRMHVGYQLSYPEEQLLSGYPEDFIAYDLEGLSVAILENPKAEQAVVTHGLSDDSFIRGKAPMTKEEIRSISLSKLALTKSAVVYDVGAGTGSIGIECALQACDGQVYAIEKKAEALELLKKNKEALGADNLEIVSGLAPEALEKLPKPTHAFIGGSSGNMEQIVQLLLEKNKQVRIVINAIAMETVMEVMEIIKKYEFAETDIVQVSVGKAKVLADYHMMMGQNPVYIFTLQNKE